MTGSVMQRKTLVENISNSVVKRGMWQKNKMSYGWTTAVRRFSWKNLIDFNIALYDL
jgi:hypothetical protein